MKMGINDSVFGIRCRCFFSHIVASEAPRLNSPPIGLLSPTSCHQCPVIVPVLTRTGKGGKYICIYCECCAYDKNHVECVVNRAKIFVLCSTGINVFLYSGFECSLGSSFLCSVRRANSAKVLSLSRIQTQVRVSNRTNWTPSKKNRYERSNVTDNVGKTVYTFDINRSKNKRIGAWKENCTVLESAPPCTANMHEL